MSATTEVTVGAKGRVVLPHAIRMELEIHEGTKLHVSVVDGALMVIPIRSARESLHAMFANVGHSMAEELMAERHADADQNQ